MVADEPPAPAALVDKGNCEASFDFLSATDFLLTALLKPPGAGDDWLVSRFSAETFGVLVDDGRGRGAIYRSLKVQQWR